jgi:tRNA (guanine37-N1)-methyltransferase
VLYRVFTLHPEIFESFTSHSLIARAISKNIINVEYCNWREDFGHGNYHQVDDRPYGGGTGMVLLADPVFNALTKYDAVSDFFEKNIKQNHQIVPNNSSFYATTALKNNYTKATVMLTPRGFALNQEISTWLSKFQELNILCGRYEGFDARLSPAVDLEISIGNYVLNGGEVAAMSLIESTARLIPNFVTKTPSIEHDSFSKEVNRYLENQEFVIGKNNLKHIQPSTKAFKEKENLFDDEKWINNVLPFIEHPQYTRPFDWKGSKVPEILVSGDHKKIQDWRERWYNI